MSRILLLHGLGGTAATMAPLADALRAAGHRTAAPTLPGHGTEPTALLGVTWADWLAAAIAEHADVVIGQSMGAALALAQAAAGGSAAVVAINPPAPGDVALEAVEALEWRRERGTEWIEVGPSPLGPSAIVEVAYDRLPVVAMVEMWQGVATLDLSAVTCPVLIVTSANDDVIDPSSSDAVAAGLAGPVERLALPRSGHVAVLDVERDLLAARVVQFVRDVVQQ